MRNPVWPSSCVTLAGTSNELDVQNEWEENTQHTNTCSYICSPLWSHFWPFMPVFVDYARGMAIFLTAYLYCLRLFCAQCMCSSTRVWFSSLIIPDVWYLTTVSIYNSNVYTLSSIHYIYYVATFTTVSIVSKRLITPLIIMLPPCSSSLVSSSHSYDEPCKTASNWGYEHIFPSSYATYRLLCQYYATIQSGIATSSLCYFACQQRPFML